MFCFNSINYDNCQEILEKYVSYAKRSDGKMGLKDFASYLGLPITEPVKQIFKLYDRVNYTNWDYNSFNFINQS